MDMKSARKLHREYITRQLAFRGWNPSGFLIAAGLVEEKLENGFPIEDKKLLASFNRFLVCENSLSGPNGKKLREAMDRMGIDYLGSPTFSVGANVDQR